MAMDSNLKRFRFLIKGLDSSRFPIKLEPTVKATPTSSFFNGERVEWKFITSSDIGYVTNYDSAATPASERRGCPISHFDKRDRERFLNALESYLEKN